jgi:glycosyltransferase involved in cell wall biosynthesis
MIGFPRHVATHVRWADAVNCHLPQFEAILPVLAARALGKPAILTHHTDLSGWPGLRERVSEGALALSQEIAARFSTEIVTYTEDYAAHSHFVRRAGKSGKRVTCLLPPVVTYPVDPTLRTRLVGRIGVRRHTLGFAGRIARQKGLPYLLQAMRIVAGQLDGCVLALAGPHQDVIGEDHLVDLHAAINAAGCPVVFLGPLQPEEMPTFYDILDLLVLPSADTLESFGLVQIEAMYCGCPVVATDLPGVRIPIQSSGMGEIVPPADPPALAEAIIRVLRCRQRYVRPAATIARLFDPEPTYRHYAEAFERAGRHRPGSRAAG